MKGPTNKGLSMVYKWLCRNSEHDESPYQPRVVVCYTSGFVVIPRMIKAPNNKGFPYGIQVALPWFRAWWKALPTKGCLMVYKWLCHNSELDERPYQQRVVLWYTSGFVVLLSMMKGSTNKGLSYGTQVALPWFPAWWMPLPTKGCLMVYKWLCLDSEHDKKPYQQGLPYGIQA